MNVYDGYVEICLPFSLSHVYISFNTFVIDMYLLINSILLTHFLSILYYLMILPLTNRHELLLRRFPLRLITVVLKFIPLRMLLLMVKSKRK